MVEQAPSQNPKRADELMALAERVEKAAEPDRELEFAVGAAAGWTLDREQTPQFTRSLDAAMMLVPEGWGGLLGIPVNGGCRLQHNAPVGPTVEAKAAIPALALTAACLRALASQEQNP